MHRFKVPILGTVLPFLLVAGLSLLFTDVALPTYEVASPDPKVLSAQRPFIEEKILGTSEEGRPVTGYVIGHGNETIFLFGGIHGNEKGTVTLLHELVAEVEQRPELVSDDKRLVIIPLTNPDGYLEREDKLNANAVNLNRNFFTDDWIREEGDYETYAGEEPFSERESRLIRAVVEEYTPTIMIAFHSQGALVSPEFNQGSLELATWYADASGYEYFDEWDYAGTATRWFVESARGAAITVELPTHESSDWEANGPALLQFVSRE